MEKYNLGPELLKTKREGALDVSGEVIGSNPNGDCLRMISNGTGKKEFTIRMLCKDQESLLENNIEKTIFSYASKEEKCRTVTKFPPQSERTHIVLEKIFSGQDCGLPAYVESKEAHVPLLKTLLAHLSMLQHRSVDI